MAKALAHSDRPTFVAHVRGDGQIQSLESHLSSVSQLASELAEKFGLRTHGALLGLLHDLGKYSAAFQIYIQSATGLLNQDEDEEFVDAAGLKGQIDHSSSGAQWIWLELAQQGDLARRYSLSSRRGKPPPKAFSYSPLLPVRIKVRMFAACFVQ